MEVYKGKATIGKLDKNQGGYFYLKLQAEIVNQFPQKRLTRLICNLENKVSFRCGLNHFGDGNFFIIVSRKYFETIDIGLGDTVQFELREDPDPLGVEMPEVLESLLEQDPDLKQKFDKLTFGRQRTIIHRMNKIKDLDKQISRTIELINTAHLPRRKKEIN